MLLEEKQIVLSATDKHCGRKVAASMVHVKLMILLVVELKHYHGSILLHLNSRFDSFLYHLTRLLNSHFGEVTK